MPNKTKIRLKKSKHINLFFVLSFVKFRNMSVLFLKFGARFTWILLTNKVGEQRIVLADRDWLKWERWTKKVQVETIIFNMFKAKNGVPWFISRVYRSDRFLNRLITLALFALGKKVKKSVSKTPLSKSLKMECLVERIARENLETTSYKIYSN